MTPALEAIAARLQAGERVTDADAAVLADTRDILTLGMLADDVRRRRHGNETTFVRVACVTLPPADAVPEIPPGAGELRIAGPLTDFDAACAAIARLAASANGRPVSACALEDLEAVARASGRPLGELLKALAGAGVSAVASASLDLLASPEASLTAVREAGLGLAAFGVRHTASVEDRLAHIRQARAVQQSLGWLTAFAPLGVSWAPGSPSTGYDDVRQVALARLLIDNVASIQVDWSKYGPKLAQVALTVGADDLDAVSPLDDTGEGRRRGPLEEVRRNITAAGFVAVERDGAWTRVRA